MARKTKGSSNSNLHKAKVVKNDEFYTRLTDVEKELYNYRPHFKDKIVYCNCDDPGTSKFVYHLIYAFNLLGLKKLLATGYNEGGKGVKLVYTGSRNETAVPDDDEVVVGEMEGDGSFDSAESIEFLKEADIVVTNPPFSLFRDYIKLMMEYDKKFLVIGNKNALTYKEIFPLIKENKLWMGICSPSEFDTPDGSTKKIDGLCRWFTNLTHYKRNEELILFRKYNPKTYPKYDNYDAINVDKVDSIPCDYTEERVVTSEELQRLRDNGFQVTVLGEV